MKSRHVSRTGLVTTVAAVAAVLALLKLAGVNIGAILAVLALPLAFAVRPPVCDLLGGIQLALNFKVGEFVWLEDIDKSGTIRDIGWQSVTLEVRSFDPSGGVERKELIVPNSRMVEMVVER